MRVCHGVYALAPPDVVGRLAALDLMTGRPMVACMNTAAALYGFDTEADPRVHVLDPAIRMRPTDRVSIPIVVDDVRRRPFDLVGRIFTHLQSREQT